MDNLADVFIKKQKNEKNVTKTTIFVGKFSEVLL